MSTSGLLHIEIQIGGIYMLPYLLASGIEWGMLSQESGGMV